MNTEPTNVIKTFNLKLLINVPVLFFLGILTLYSATQGSAGIQNLFKTQLLFFGLGILLSLTIIFLDEVVLEKLSYAIYMICLILLIAVLFVGDSGGGAQRWLRLGPIGIQPSELSKLAIVFAFAKYFNDDKSVGAYTLKRLLIPGLLMLPPIILILLQPDLGTATIVFLGGASIIFFLKIQWRSVWIVVLLSCITLPLGYRFALKEYQRERLKTFLDPGRDPRGSGYNALQCKIAVGSGEITGKGFLKGTQSQLNFIPEHHTDFIFAVFSEERGFIGAVVLLILYFFYCSSGLKIASQARSKFQMLLAIGLTSILFWHVVISLGMVTGILPIVGVTLPFFSYGGSSLLTFMIITALLLNLSRKKYIF